MNQQLGRLLDSLVLGCNHQVMHQKPQFQLGFLPQSSSFQNTFKHFKHTRHFCLFCCFVLMLLSQSVSRELVGFSVSFLSLTINYLTTLHTFFFFGIFFVLLRVRLVLFPFIFTFEVLQVLLVRVPRLSIRYVRINFPLRWHRRLFGGLKIDASAKAFG